MKKIKEMLHGHNESDTTYGNQTYSTSSTTSTVPEREIIGDKIDRSGTWERDLPKHSHLPADSATYDNSTYLGKESTHHVPSASTTTTSTSTFTPIGSTSASHHSTYSKELPKSTMTTKSAVVQPVMQPAVITPVTTTSTNAVPLTTTRAATVTSVPVQYERMEKPTVIQERVLPIQKEEIQPIIHREREQLDVKQITEQLHETKIQPTLIQQRSLAPEVKPVAVMPSAPIAPNLVQPSVQYEAAQRCTVVYNPIVEETVKKTIIEEVQPVIQRDVVAPTIIQEVKPIYEKVVEAPRVFRETLPTRELGVNGATEEFQRGFGLAQPQQSTASSWNSSNLNNQQQGQQQFSSNSGLSNDFSRQTEYKQELNSGLLGEHSPLHTGQSSLNEQDKFKTFDSNKYDEKNSNAFKSQQQQFSSGTQYPTSH